MTGIDRVAVLVAACGAPWEVAALQQLAVGAPRLVLLKRCVDLNDLLASATTGEAQVALVAHELPGLDADSVGHLRRCGLGVVMVGDDEAGSDIADRAGRFGVSQVLSGSSMARLGEVVTEAAASLEPSLPATTGPAEARPVPDQAHEPGRTVAVWGPTGAPGRTTVAVGVAAELAHRGLDTFLADVDGFGGAVAQHLGILDEISGLLAAARLANSGQLGHDRLATLARRVTPSLRVLTGLPRADRWPEVRAAAFDEVLDRATGTTEFLVLDTSFNLELESVPFGSTAPQRNGMTLAALERADEVVVVGSADPVGLARLARGLVELLEVVPGSAVHVAVNRARPSLGWGEKEIRTMIEGFVTPRSVHFLPEDRVTADRALMSGKSLAELGDSPLRRALAGLVDALTGAAAVGRARHRLFGRGR